MSVAAAAFMTNKQRKKQMSSSLSIVYMSISVADLSASLLHDCVSIFNKNWTLASHSENCIDNSFSAYTPKTVQLFMLKPAHMYASVNLASDELLRPHSTPNLIFIVKIAYLLAEWSI